MKRINISKIKINEILLVYDNLSNTDTIKCVDFQWKGTVRRMKEGSQFRQ